MNLPLIRWFFLAIALAALIWVIIKNWNPLAAALATLSWQIAAAGFLLAVVYVFFTLWPWRVILADFGISTRLEHSHPVIWHQPGR